MIFLPTVLYKTLSFLYRSIILLPNMLWSFYITFLVHSSDDLHATVQHNQLKNHPLSM